MAFTNETSATIVTTGCSGEIYGIEVCPRPSFESVFRFLVVFSRFRPSYTDSGGPGHRLVKECTVRTVVLGTVCSLAEFRRVNRLEDALVGAQGRIHLDWASWREEQVRACSALYSTS